MTAFIKSGHVPVSTTIVDQQIEQGKTFEEWWAAEDTNGLSEACKMSAWNAWLAATKQAELARPEVGEMLPAIWLRREGGESDVGRVVVLVEVGGKWHEVIREVEGCAFSHIVEPLGIKAKVAGTNTV